VELEHDVEAAAEYAWDLEIHAFEMTEKQAGLRFGFVHHDYSPPAAAAPPEIETGALALALALHPVRAAAVLVALDY
jgi:hypothetical protein